MLRIHNETLRAFCEQEGAWYIPVAEEIEGGTELFKDVCHMTEAGIEAKAGVVCRHVGDILAKEQTVAEKQSG